VIEAEIKRLADLGDRRAQTAKVPVYNRLCKWFKEDFGRGSERGHTALHVGKSDYCAMCLSLEIDLGSAIATLAKHRTQEDQTEERKLEISELETLISDLKAAKDQHAAVATDAVKNYDAKTNAARQNYVKDTKEWNRIRQLYAAGELSEEGLDAAFRVFEKSTLVVESDYQMDKHAPHWVQTPQPGPSYFMSHETFYIGGVLSASLGVGDGETKKKRNHVYMRSQYVGDRRIKLSKNSNDTATAIHHFLGGAQDTGYRPSPYRTGYPLP